MTLEADHLLIARSLDDANMLAAVATNEDYRQRELVEGLHVVWQYPGRPLHEFEYTFESVYPDEIQAAGTLPVWLQKLADNGSPIHVLNFMGSTNVLEDLYYQRVLTRGVAVCLANIAQPIHNEMGISVVDGDILLERTWERLSQTMRATDIDDFQLIFSYPQRGNTNPHVTGYLDVSWEIHRRLYGLLAPRGVLLAEKTQSMINSHCLEEFIPAFQRAAGSGLAKLHGEYFSLVKTDAVAQLPEFQYVAL